MSAAPRERPDKAKIQNLPPHAQFQWVRKMWYVYFPYSYRTAEGKLKQERDYIGTLSPDGTAFVPNRTYRLTGCPAWEDRPPENWKDPEKRAEALSKNAKSPAPSAKPGKSTRTQAADPSLDLPMPGGEADFTPKGQPRTFESLNLDSGKILEFAKRRAARFPRGDLLAFDALIASEASEHNTNPAKPPVRVLLVADAATGAPVCWGIEPAGSTGLLDAHLRFWKTIGLPPERMVLCGQHGHFQDDEVLTLLNGTCRFLLLVDIFEENIRKVLNSRRKELIEPINLLTTHSCYAISDSCRLADRTGREADVQTFLYRSAAKEEEAIVAFNAELSDFRKLWSKADSPEARALLRGHASFAFFEESEGKLVIRRDVFNAWCREFGICAVYASRNFTQGGVIGLFLKTLALRLDYERLCGDSLRTVPVRSETSLMGLLFTSFITLTILQKQAAMKKEQDR